MKLITPINDETPDNNNEMINKLMMIVEINDKGGTSNDSSQT